MGLFGKKKNSDSSDSVLSESEIQKKLYGEFETGPAYVVPRERESFKERASSPVLPKETPSEKELPHDLFTAPKDEWVHPDLPPRQTFAEPKPSDATPRYVPLHDFEKRVAAPAAPASGTDSYSRFRYNRPQENGVKAFLGLGKDVVGKGQAFVEKLLDPKRVALRRFIYWGAALLVVFILFWGVNTLNSQREQALRVRYKMSGAVVPAAVTAPAVPVPVVEREVTITPAPVRIKKNVVPGAPRTGASQSTASYVIQVVTYPSKPDAEQIVAALKKAGLRAFVQENARPSGRVFYLVLIGSFHTAADAQAELSKFRALEAARPFQDSFVRTNRS